MPELCTIPCHRISVLLPSECGWLDQRVRATCGPVLIKPWLLHLGCSTDTISSSRLTLAMGKQASLNMASFLHCIARRYLTAATIFRGKIASREVCFPLTARSAIVRSLARPGWSRSRTALEEDYGDWYHA